MSETRDAKRAKEEPRVRILQDDTMVGAVTEWIPTGIVELDHLYGGGLPVGRHSEAFGPEASGKTAQLIMAIRGVHRMGGIAYVFDYEHNMVDDLKRASRQSPLDMDRIVYSRPKTIEKAETAVKETLDKLIAAKTPFPVLFGFDSVAAAPPNSEYACDDPLKRHVGGQSHSYAQMYRSITGRVADARCHFMFINQERDKIGGMQGYGPTYVTPGGKSAKYFSSLRTRQVKMKTLKAGDKPSGMLVRTMLVKSRGTVPGTSATWCIDFKRGPSPQITAFQTLLAARLVKNAGGGNYTVPGLRAAVSKDKYVDLCAGDPHLWAEQVSQVQMVLDRGLLEKSAVEDASDD